MNFRTWLLTEKAIPGLDYSKGLHSTSSPLANIRYVIYRNPTRQEADQAFEAARNLKTQFGEDDDLGGFITKNDDVFVWPRAFAEHADIYHHLNQTPYVTFYIRQDKTFKTAMNTQPSKEEAIRIMEGHPKITQMLGKPAVLLDPDYDPNRKVLRPGDDEAKREEEWMTRVLRGEDPDSPAMKALKSGVPEPQKPSWKQALAGGQPWRLHSDWTL